MCVVEPYQMGEGNFLATMGGDARQVIEGALAQGFGVIIQIDEANSEMTLVFAINKDFAKQSFEEGLRTYDKLVVLLPMQYTEDGVVVKQISGSTQKLKEIKADVLNLIWQSKVGERGQ